jgi:hypothetical protein
MPVHVVIDRADLVPRAVLAGAVSEAAAVWIAYGVEVDRPDSDPSSDCDRVHKVIRVSLSASQRARKREHVLGEALYDANAADWMIILHYTDVVRIATDARAFGEHAAFWPAPVRDQIIGRALGRVLAHEIGHILLRQSQHSTTGLMQAGQVASRLADYSRDALALTQIERARLHMVVEDLLSRERSEACDRSRRKR